MTFDEAKKTVLPFGRYKGKTFDEVAETDGGLCYLDWAWGELQHLSPNVRKALETYLAEPVIAAELDKLIG